ncbi:MAG: phosphoadenylyl-sulfate reductase [Deltaproteobacteria bacterium]|nr:phosphoadenylyl-sulfate reductase [Deltaproteobacteria bacterium]
MAKTAVAKMESTDFENKTAQEVLQWALETYHPKITCASSFGAEDVVVIDMLVKIRKDARIFTLDTGRLPQATYDVMQALMDKYGIKFEVYHPKADAVEEMVSQQGPNLFYESIENRKRCCGVRKMEPLSRALKGMEAWITGLRREQAVTRTDTPRVEIDKSQGGIVKVNPIIDWTTDQTWDYIKKNKVPYNKLHDQGYPSIGCEPCTRAIKPGEDLRAGRWWWESPEYKECGLHLKK